MSEWIRHRGSKSIPKCLEGKKFEVRYRDGAVFEMNSDLRQTSDMWTHDGVNGDIMAYKIVGAITPPDYSKGFPVGTTAKDIGAKVGDEFVIVSSECTAGEVGEIVKFRSDDGSVNPYFFGPTGNPHCISWWKLSPIPPKTAIELQAEEVGIAEQEWPEDRVDVVGQNGNDGLHYDDIHLGIKRPDGEGFVKYNAGDVIDLNGVDSIDWYAADAASAKSPNPAGLRWADGEYDQIAWYRLNYTEQIDTSPERVEIEQENVRITPETLTLRDIAPALKAAGVTIKLEDDPRTAPDFLQSALQTLTQRGKDYDKPEGERSAAAVAVAFNAITGRNLTEAEVWLVLQLVKDVRQWHNPGSYHADSALDCVAYAALKAEALARK